MLTVTFSTQEIGPGIIEDKSLHYINYFITVTCEKCGFNKAIRYAYKSTPASGGVIVTVNTFSQLTEMNNHEKECGNLNAAVR